MSFTLYSPSTEITCTNVEGLRRENAKLVVSKPFLRVGDYIKRYTRASYPYTRKAVESSHSVPTHLERSRVSEKQLKEPRKKLDFVRTLLIDNYDSYTYNIYQELSIVNGVPPVVVRNDEWTWEDVCHFLYEEDAFDNIVISPGPGTPTCPADIGICLQLLLKCPDVPILGVCLGHQALGYAHGARIVHAAEPVHGRLSEIEHSDSKLFDGIPSGKNSGFKVVRYHSLIIDPESLPKELIPIAWTSSDNKLSSLGNNKFGVVPDAYGSQAQHENLDLNSGKSKNGYQSEKVLMGVMHESRPHYGVQFHPESVATCHGKQIFKNFREITKDYWLKKRSSRINGKKSHIAAQMQVPHTSRLFSEVPGVAQLLNNNTSSWHYGEADVRQLECDADKNSSGVLNTVNGKPVKTPAKFVKLKWRKLDLLATQVGGSSNIFSELYGKDKAENTFWLDSSSTEKGRARFSFMGGKGGSLWKQVTFRLSDKRDAASRYGGHLLVEDAEGSISSTHLKEGFFDFLNKELLSLCYDENDYKGLPFDFYGGFIGYIGYNLKVECGAASNHHKSRTPDACLFFADNLLVVDHKYDEVYILSIHEENATESTWLDDTQQKLISLIASATNNVDNHTSHAARTTSNAGFDFEKSREQYIRDVRKCQQYIKDGESYELCLTTQTRKSVGEIDSLGLYLHLREKNPAPYASWLNFSKENLCICSSSPERFLRLDRNGILEAKPIKGTIARGASLEEDQRLKSQLQYSEKDQAENLMIVDLLRNDLGRVCEPGSVHVPNLMDVESYATVHTMVSTIRGKKRSDISAVDCVKAAFPGGSMTGAPKLRSMELLDSLEASSRGIYSGSIGFFSYHQTFDLNIVIRTVVIHEGEASIGAGGAITALSIPEDEYEEMLLKTRAPTKAVMEF